MRRIWNHVRARHGGGKTMRKTMRVTSIRDGNSRLSERFRYVMATGFVPGVSRRGARGGGRGKVKWGARRMGSRAVFLSSNEHHLVGANPRLVRTTGHISSVCVEVEKSSSPGGRDIPESAWGAFPPFPSCGRSRRRRRYVGTRLVSVGIFIALA